MIGGNTTITIQKQNGTEKNAIGEQVPAWEDVQTIKGWLDLMSGNSGYIAYSAKVQESTHIFICDYVPMAKGVDAENARAVIGTKTYDIMLIDNPMEMNRQLEIYLKYTGGQ